MSITFKTAGGPVTLSVAISGTLRWNYSYARDDKSIHLKGADEHQKDYLMGLATDLDNDLDSWTVRVLNPTDGEQEYKIQFVWRQDGEALSSWKKSGKVKGGATKSHDGETWFLGE